SSEIIAHDLKRDLLALEASGFTSSVLVDVSRREESKRVFDTMIASYLAEAASSHSFEEVAAQMLGTRVEGFRSTRDGTAAGVTLLPKLAQELRSQLREANLEKLFNEVEIPLVFVLTRMEQRGILLDVEHLQMMSADVGRRLDS